MKTLNLLFIATALLLATACTDTEKVLPYDTASTVSFEQNDQQGDVITPTKNLRHIDLNVDQGSTEEADYTGQTDKNCENCDHEARQSDQKYFGELLPASFLDCGTFIRLTDDQLFEVFNTDLIRDDIHFEEGGPVAFSYVTSEDLPSSCGIGTPIELVTISFLSEGNTGSVQANTKGSGKN